LPSYPSCGELGVQLRVGIVMLTDLRPTRQSHVVTGLNGEGMRCVQ